MPAASPHKAPVFHCSLRQELAPQPWWDTVVGHYSAHHGFLTAGVMAWWGSNLSSCHIPAFLDLNPVGREEGQGVTETCRLDTAEQGKKKCQQCDQETKLFASINYKAFRVQELPAIYFKDRP